MPSFRKDQTSDAEASSEPVLIITMGSSSYRMICPNCSTCNPANANSCGGCGYPLDDVAPVCVGEAVPMPLSESILPDENTTPWDPPARQEEITLQLENLRTQKRVSLTLKADDTTMLGYNGALANQFQSTAYVSGQHLYLSYRKGSVWIKDQSRNGTYLNGTRLERGVEHPLPNNCVIGLGDSSASTLQAAFFKITY